MKQIETTGRTVEDAVREALVELGAERDSVHIEVLDEGSKGFLGLLGGKPARVRVSLKEMATQGASEVELEEKQDVSEDAQLLQRNASRDADDVDLEEEWHQAIERAKQFVFGIAERLQMDVDIAVEEADDNIVHLNLSGDNVGLIIGRHGQTLDSIQYLANVVANRVRGMRVRIVLDVE